MNAHGLANFCASMNLNEVFTHTKRGGTVSLCARVQVDLAKSSIRDNGVGSCSFVFLIIAHEMLYGSGDASGLQTIDVRGGEDPWTRYRVSSRANHARK